MSEVLTQAFDVMVAALIVVLALAVLFIPGLFRSAVLFIVFGLVLSLAWVRLDAFDIALAEAAIGAGLLGVLIVGAATQFERGSERGAALGSAPDAEPGAALPPSDGETE